MKPNFFCMVLLPKYFMNRDAKLYLHQKPIHIIKCYFIYYLLDFILMIRDVSCECVLQHKKIDHIHNFEVKQR